jgi:predicted Zn finger-like uncharacterized protein
MVKLRILEEERLRLRIKEKHVEVYSIDNPSFILGREYLGNYPNTEDFNEVWEAVDLVIGNIMPVDLVDEEYLDDYDIISFIGGELSQWICPNCKANHFINRKEYNIARTDIRCNRCLALFEVNEKVGS